MFVVNSQQMRDADAHAIEVLKIPSLTLMENAASRVVDAVLARYTEPKATLVVCGKGNNGGDGLAVARLLQIRGWKAVALLLGSSRELKSDPAENWKRAVQAGVECHESAADPAVLDPLLSQSELVIDALFGTGLAKPLEGFYSEAVQRINRAGKEVISIDVPSGLSSESGALPGPAVKASATVALAALKFCHVLSPACRMSGEVYVADIGIPVDSTISVIRREDVARLLPHRAPDSNKGTFGHAVVIAGSRGKSGAAYMTGKAALRCGAGLSTVFSPADVQMAIASLGPEIMTESAPGSSSHFGTDAAGPAALLLSGKNAVAIGPGIGTDPDTLAFFRQLLPQISSALVIDADGLNLLSNDISILKERKPWSTVLTPHPGEMGRLLGRSTAEIQKNRIESAQRLAMQTQSVVVLKGYRTLIADPSGKIRVNLTGGQALASAGTGDVLTGLITGFIAQGLAPVDAATAGVFLHGLSANLFESEFPQQAMNAMDIVHWWNRTVHIARTYKHLEDEYLKIHFSF